MINPCVGVSIELTAHNKAHWMRILERTTYDVYILHHAVRMEDQEIALAGLAHILADNTVTRWAVRHSDPVVILAALRHHKANSTTVDIARMNPIFKDIIK